jgi:hypothetical protein
MAGHPYHIFYESRELARELGDPLLGTVEAETPEEAVRKAERDPDIARKAMPCCGFWAVRARIEDHRRGYKQ